MKNKLLLIAILLLVAFSGKARADETQTQEVRRQYMSYCLANGGMREICLCSFDNSQNIMSIGELGALTSELTNGLKPDSGLMRKLNKVTLKCARDPDLLKSQEQKDSENGIPGLTPPPPPPPTLEPIPDKEQILGGDDKGTKNYFEDMKNKAAAEAAAKNPVPQPPQPSTETKAPVKATKTSYKNLPKETYFGQYNDMFFDVISRADVEGMRALSNKIKNMEIKDKSGNTPLIVAILSGQPTSAKFLISKGADINATNPKGQTALHFASFSKRPDLVDTLLNAKKINLNPTYGDGYTPLMLAVKQQDISIINLLLRNKANPNLKLKDGNTALHAAAAGQKADIIDALARAGAKLDAVNNGGYTPLMVASYTGNIGAVNSLLAQGANTGIRDSAGRSAAELATGPYAQQIAAAIAARR